MQGPVIGGGGGLGFQGRCYKEVTGLDSQQRGHLDQDQRVSLVQESQKRRERPLPKEQEDEVQIGNWSTSSLTLAISSLRPHLAPSLPV